MSEHPVHHPNSTRLFLVCGMIVGPFYLAVGLAQALLRDGFDLSRHSLSVLANGSLGWIQTVNFILCGLMVVAAAAGLGRALRAHSRVAGWLLGSFGGAMLGAAIFPADPIDGFPIGTPEGFPTTISTAGLIHFLVGGLGFIALAASCFAIAVAMARRKSIWMTSLSTFSGLSVIIGFFAPFLLPAAGPVAGIWFSVVVGWTWLTLVSFYLYRSDR